MKPVHTLIDPEPEPGNFTPRKVFCFYPEDWSDAVDYLEARGWEVEIMFESQTFGGYADVSRVRDGVRRTFGLSTITHESHAALLRRQEQLGEPF